MRTFLHFVFIIPSYNNQQWYYKNLYSIINQTYKKWRVIYINDHSTDNTDLLVKKFIEKYSLKDKIIYIKNIKRMFQAYSRYIAYQRVYDYEYCIFLDGDDWLYNNNVLERLNIFLTTNNLLCSYGTYKIFSKNRLTMTYIADYNYNVINKCLYRKVNFKASHLRVSRANLIKSINIYDIIDNFGNFLNCCTDLAEAYCYLEQSNTKHKKNPCISVVYNKSNSVKYINSWYIIQDDLIKKTYYKMIKNNICNRTPYKIPIIKKSIITIIDNSYSCFDSLYRITMKYIFYYFGRH